MKRRDERKRKRAISPGQLQPQQHQQQHHHQQHQVHHHHRLQRQQQQQNEDQASPVYYNLLDEAALVERNAISASIPLSNLAGIAFNSSERPRNPTNSINDMNITDVSATNDSSVSDLVRLFLSRQTLGPSLHSNSSTQGAMQPNFGENAALYSYPLSLHQQRYIACATTPTASVATNFAVAATDASSALHQSSNSSAFLQANTTGHGIETSTATVSSTRNLQQLQMALLSQVRRNQTELLVPSSVELQNSLLRVRDGISAARLLPNRNTAILAQRLLNHSSSQTEWNERILSTLRGTQQQQIDPLWRQLISSNTAGNIYPSAAASSIARAHAANDIESSLRINSQVRSLLHSNDNNFNSNRGLASAATAVVAPVSASNAAIKDGGNDATATNTQYHVSAGMLSLRLPCLLALPGDELKLNAYQCLLRNQIEAFQAAEIEVTTHARGRNKPIVVGQVGIRCRHCSHVPISQRQKGSSYFPSSMHGIYQAAQNMSTTHMQGGLCNEIPSEIQDLFQKSIGLKGSASFAGRPFWAESARKLGLVDTDCGMFFVHNIPDSVQVIAK